MKAKIFLSTLSLFMMGVVYAQTNVEHIIPVEKNLSTEFKKSLYDTESYSYSGEDLKTIGMPCGGIAAGQLYVRGDGTLAYWWIANNAYNTGYGVDSLNNFETVHGKWSACYETFEPASYFKQYFELTVEDKKQKITKRLDKSGFDAIEFIGEYPIAKITYKDKEDKLPVDISMEVFSPFIPLDAQKSATPGTILKFKVKNISKRKVTVGLNGVLQNMVMHDLQGKVEGISKNKVHKEKGLSGIGFEFIADDKNKETHPYYGNMMLSILDESAVADADISTDKLDADASKRLLNEGNELLGALETNFELSAGESKEIVFLLTWYFPNRPMIHGQGYNWNNPIPTEGKSIGNMYANWFDSSSDVAHYLQSNFNSLTEQTYLFHKTWYEDSALPYWLKHRIMMPVSILATETCQWLANGRVWAWEGVGSCEGTCTHVWNYAQAQARLFPELERNLRERTDFAKSFRKDGGVDARNGNGGVAIDGHAGTILKLYREHLMSKDILFLSRNWDNVKKAMEFIIKLDEKADGLIEGQQFNTYDISFYGGNTYVGGLYLGALRAAEEMAYLMNDHEIAKRYRNIYESGKKLSEERLWNGEYFIQDVDFEKHPSHQYGKGCLSDQMFGQTWAHQLNLGHLYDGEKVKKTLESIWKYNWTADVEAHNRKYVPERTYADYGEAGLFIATYPNSKHLDKDAVRYRNEVWTGIEYQVATNMIDEGMIDEGLAITRAVHDRYYPSKHNPWNEIECGDHYARALASWGILIALEDYHYDGPQGILGFAPKINKDNFCGFFTAAEGWGNLNQQITSDEQVNSVNVKWGNVKLSELNVPECKGKNSVEVKVGDTVLSCKLSRNNGVLNIKFDEQNLQTNQEIIIIQQ